MSSSNQKLITVLKAFRDSSQSPDETDRLRMDLLSRYIEIADLERITADAANKISKEKDRAFLSKCLAEIHAYQPAASS